MNHERINRLFRSAVWWGMGGERVKSIDEHRSW